MTRLARARERLLDTLPPWVTDKVPRDHWETDAAFRRRRKVTAVVSVAGAGLLGMSLSTRPGSKEFYGLTLAVAGVWTAGGLLSGPLHLGWQLRGDDKVTRPVTLPVVSGAGVFAFFYGCALVARKIPPLNHAIASVLQYADEGDSRLVLLTTLANGAAEEVFFRGALYAAVGDNNPVLVSTGVYTLATVVTRNPALVIAAAVMGAIFGVQRRHTGGIEASLLTHLTWSTLMLKYLPPLFEGEISGATAAG